VPNRVLIVDDNATVCELIQEVLSSAEMESCTLTDSEQAATRVTEERFDAVFLDVRMPAPDGIELTRQIRASGLNRRTPIVIITGEEDNAVLKRAFEAACSEGYCLGQRPFVTAKRGVAEVCEEAVPPRIVMEIFDFDKYIVRALLRWFAPYCRRPRRTAVAQGQDETGRRLKLGWNESGKVGSSGCGRFNFPVRYRVAR
jgi:CheY-like chemotaxis protein